MGMFEDDIDEAVRRSNEKARAEAAVEKARLEHSERKLKEELQRRNEFSTRIRDVVTSSLAATVGNTDPEVSVAVTKTEIVGAVASLETIVVTRKTS